MQHTHPEVLMHYNFSEYDPAATLEVGSPDKYNQNAFQSHRRGMHDNNNRSRARKMSATPPQRGRQGDFRTNLIMEEINDEDEREINQRLRTLQFTRWYGMQQNDFRPQDDAMSPLINRKHHQGFYNINQSNFNLKGIGAGGCDSSRQLNPKDSIFRKLSNYASNGYEGDGRSELEVDKWPDITKAQKATQSEKDDGSQGEEEEEFVSLEDQELDKLESI